MPSLIDLVGKQFSYLTVIARSPRGPRAWWICRCICGKETEASSVALKVGDKKSCGCKTLEMCSVANKKHGHTWEGGRSPTNHSFKTMKSRCNNPKDSHYADYGGRGIKVCERWNGPNGFIYFLEDMGERPENTTLDRIDNDGPYCKENCRWATAEEQQGNRRNNILIPIEGKTVCLAEAARIIGINENTLYGRIVRKGWPIELAISLPTQEEIARDPITGQWAKLVP